MVPVTGDPALETAGPAGVEPAWAASCLNCQALLHGPFCGQCGQRALPPHPTVHELAGDAFNELSGWDGKFAATLRTLVRRPGELTRVLLEGRRVRFVSPVRVYLLCSLVYFFVAAVVPTPVETVEFTEAMEFEVGFGISSGGDDPTPGDAALAKAIAVGTAALSAAERTALETKIAETPPLLRPIVRAVAEDYRGLRRRVTATMPRALFVLVPALALILAVFHRGRPYPDHLYFAIHFQAFVFVMLTASALAVFSGSLVALAVLQTAAIVWIVIYGILAQRRVYGGTWLATGLKAVGVAVLYGSLWSVTTVVVTLWVSRAT